MASSVGIVTQKSRNPLDRFAAVLLWVFTALGFLFLLSPYRLLPDLFLLACVILWRKNPRFRSARSAALILTMFLVMEFWLPFDFSLVYRPGFPRILPLVMGFGSGRPEGGETVGGGCIVMGNEPRWILVW